MTRRGARLILVAATISLIAACGSTASNGPANASPTVPAATPTGVPSPTAAPAASPLPPLAVVEIDGRATPGILGTYTLDGSGSDAPWQPFGGLPVIEVAAGAPLVVAFADGAPIGGWVAQLAAADDPTGANPSGFGGVDQGLDAASVTTGPMPAGRWVLAVRLFRVDGRGDGITYWAVTAR
ncbi:MAG: hypothetical protein HYX57_09035 [Chloroflexi bacterium]|nr:hypothetical protein [Chloroflexota bacterium]